MVESNNPCEPLGNLDLRRVESTLAPIVPYLAERRGFVGEFGGYWMPEESRLPSSELHKAYSPFFQDPDLAGKARRGAEERLHFVSEAI